MADTLPAEKKCRCDEGRGAWLVTPPPICNEFVADDDGICINCDHDEACHERSA
jgi:hypothetical protein